MTVGVLLPALPAVAQGIIIGPDMQVLDLDLQRHSVVADVQDRFAVVTVEHEFQNNGYSTVEGRFMLPLPPEAQISDFSMTVNGEPMQGEVMEEERAQEIYESIVRENMDPALLEMVDYRTFQARLFPIPPGESRTITLRYDAELRMDRQTVRFSYPMQGTLSARSVGPRPRPLPRPLETPRNAQRPEPVNTLQSLIRVHVRGSNGVQNLYSPSHAIDVRRTSNQEAEAVFEATDALDGRDFVLYYNLDQSDLGATLLTHRPYTDQPGYFMLMLDPPMEFDERQVQPQDIVFVLDTSGSMRADKMEQARDALRYCLNHLGDRDRFGLISFSTDVEVFRPELRPASARDDALYFVDQLEASGGTNINEALLAAANLLQGTAGTIVFITDGLPSIGITDEADIRANVQEANAGVRVFSFGVGYDVNTRLLDGLSANSGGFADYISLEENIETRIASFFDKVRYPVMTNLRLELTGADAYAIVPKILPDLYKDTQLIVVGRYRSPGKPLSTLAGRLADQWTIKRYQFRFPTLERDYDFIARLWATRRVGQLLEAIRLNGENKELKDEVIALAKEYGLVTPYTSYLVQEEERFAGNQNVSNRMDANLSFAPTEAAMQESTGEMAVEASKQIRAMREAHAFARPTSPNQRIINDRIMLETRDGRWEDSAFDADNNSIVRLRFASDAYFRFLRLYPEARPFARLGSEVTFFFNDVFVQIGDREDSGLSATRLQTLFG